MQKFTCTRPVYENCRMLAPDGAVLANCDSKKIAWYVEKGLGKIVQESPLTVQLNFEPNN